MGIYGHGQESIPSCTSNAATATIAAAWKTLTRYVTYSPSLQSMQRCLISVGDRVCAGHDLADDDRTGCGGRADNQDGQEDVLEGGGSAV